MGKGRPATSGPTVEWCKTYITSIPGILKILEIIFSIIAFPCSVTIGYYWPGHGGGWVNFVSVFALIYAVICFAVHILNLVPWINMPLFIYIELISHVVFAVFFMIAGIVAAVAAATQLNKDNAGDYYFYLFDMHGRSSVGAASFFCFACMILWAVDTVLQFLEVRKGSTGGSSNQPPTAAGPASESQYPGATY